MPVKYVLVDGHFFFKLCEEYGKLFEVNFYESINWNDILGGGLRAIYYDALPSREKEESLEDFDRRLRLKQSQLNRFRALPNFSVRDGATRLRDNSKRIQQKGVDTWIAVDAMQAALTGIADEIHIYSSDLDLYPIFEALRGTRCRGVLHYQELRTDQELVFCADIAQRITVTEIVRLSRFTELDPKSSSHMLEWRITQTLSRGNEKFQCVSSGDGRFGYNYFSKEVFREALECRSAHQLIDRLRDSGFDKSYRDLGEFD